MLGAIAALALGSLFAAPAAHAHTVTCQPKNDTRTTYPYDGNPAGPDVRVFRCGTAAQLANNIPASSNLSGMAGAVSGLKANNFGPAVDAYNKLATMSPIAIEVLDSEEPGDPYTFPGPGITFLLFHDPQTYETYYSERNLDYEFLTDESACWGVTFRINGDTSVVNLFEVDTNGVSVDWVFNTDWATSHEVGHVIDKAYANLGDDSIAFSSSTIFIDMLTYDFNQFDLETDCGLGGVFNGRTGYAEPNDPQDWICSLTGGSHTGPLTPNYASEANNTAILLKATGENFAPGHVFSTLFARTSGSATSGTYGLSSYLIGGSKFECSLQLVKTVTNLGRLPTKTEMPTGCPVDGDGWELDD